MKQTNGGIPNALWAWAGALMLLWIVLGTVGGIVVLLAEDAGYALGRVLLWVALISAILSAVLWGAGELAYRGVWTRRSAQRSAQREFGPSRRHVV